MHFIWYIPFKTILHLQITSLHQPNSKIPKTTKTKLSITKTLKSKEFGKQKNKQELVHTKDTSKHHKHEKNINETFFCMSIFRSLNFQSPIFNPISSKTKKSTFYESWFDLKMLFWLKYWCKQLIRFPYFSFSFRFRQSLRSFGYLFKNGCHPGLSVKMIY